MPNYWKQSSEKKKAAAGSALVVHVNEFSVSEDSRGYPVLLTMAKVTKPSASTYAYGH